jgi:hypothetical protein
MPKFKDNFRRPERESIFVSNSSAQYESVVVETKVFRVEKLNFAYLRSGASRLAGIVFDTALLCRKRDKLAEFMKCLCGRKLIWLKNKLTLQVLYVVERAAILIIAKLNILDFFGSRSFTRPPIGFQTQVVIMIFFGYLAHEKIAIA